MSKQCDCMQGKRVVKGLLGENDIIVDCLNCEMDIEINNYVVIYLDKPTYNVRWLDNYSTTCGFVSRFEAEQNTLRTIKNIYINHR